MHRHKLPLPGMTSCQTSPEWYFGARCCVLPMMVGGVVIAPLVARVAPLDGCTCVAAEACVMEHDPRAPTPCVHPPCLQGQTCSSRATCCKRCLQWSRCRLSCTTR